MSYYQCWSRHFCAVKVSLDSNLLAVVSRTVGKLPNRGMELGPAISGVPLAARSKAGSTLVTLPRNVTPYRDSVDGTREDSVTCQKLVTWSRYGIVLWAVGIWALHQRDDQVTAAASVEAQRDKSPPSAPLPCFSFMMLLSCRVVWVCSAVRLLERFGNCEMVWTGESAIELIELYKRK